MFRRLFVATFLGSLLLSLTACYVNDDRGRDHRDQDHDHDGGGGGVIVVPDR